MERMLSLPGPLAASVKWSFVTRRVDRSAVAGIDPAIRGARPGDLVLSRVVRIGAHKRVQLASGRPSTLYDGDHLVLACGARYAPDQFEGRARLSADGADMLAGGGIVGRMQRRHARISAPTRVIPLGMLCDRAGARLNLARYALPPAPAAERRRASGMPVIAAVGASMNAGKTTAVACLANGLARAGYRVAALKITGTGAFGDVNAYADAGAALVLDFVDAGMASTYREPLDRIEAGMGTLLAAAGAAGADVVLVEFADGVFQAETAGLLGRPAMRDRIDALIYAAPDAGSVVGGLSVLRALGIEPAAVTGRVTASPLAIREAGAAGGVALTPTGDLTDPAVATALLAQASAGSSARASAVSSAGSSPEAGAGRELPDTAAKAKRGGIAA
ncbi:MAG: DUF1611 domain-containing protein [Pseudomonadota bacterium]